MRKTILFHVSHHSPLSYIIVDSQEELDLAICKEATLRLFVSLPSCSPQIQYPTLDSEYVLADESSGDNPFVDSIDGIPLNGSQKGKQQQQLPHAEPITNQTNRLDQAYSGQTQETGKTHVEPSANDFEKLITKIVPITTQVATQIALAAEKGIKEVLALSLDENLRCSAVRQAQDGLNQAQSGVQAATERASEAGQEYARKLRDVVENSVQKAMMETPSSSYLGRVKSVSQGLTPSHARSSRASDAAAASSSSSRYATSFGTTWSVDRSLLPRLKDGKAEKEDPNRKTYYPSQMKALYAMGFPNEELNLILLSKFDGSIDRVLDVLGQ